MRTRRNRVDSGFRRCNPAMGTPLLGHDTLGRQRGTGERLEADQSPQMSNCAQRLQKEVSQNDLRGFNIGWLTTCSTPGQKKASDSLLHSFGK